MTEAEPLMRRSVTIFHLFARRTDHGHADMQTALVGYNDMLQAMKLTESEITQRMKDASITGRLNPILPDVERLLGAAQRVADVLAVLDRQYKADGKPAVYCLTPEQPLAPHIEEFCKQNPEPLDAAGIRAFLNGDHAGAIVHFEESLKLLAENPDKTPTFMTRLSRAVALRELGQVRQARDELRQMLSGQSAEDLIPALAKGRARISKPCANALRAAEESLTPYGDDEAAAQQKKQTEQLLADLRENKPHPLQARRNAVAFSFGLERNLPRSP